jgi:hypothetical protein
VKSREALTAKMELARVWKGEDPAAVDEWAFRRPAGLRRFTGTHPALAVPWIEGRSWPFDPTKAAPDPVTVRSIRYRASNFVEGLTGWRPFEHRPFQLID